MWLLRSCTFFLGGLLLLSFVTAPRKAVAQSEPSLVGPPVGSLAPDFSGSAQTGRTETLASVSGPRGVVLVFFHSADWCPYCRAQLVELQRGHDALRALGFGLVAISPDPPAVLAAFAVRHALAFPLIADQGSSIIRAYGLLNGRDSSSDRVLGTPHPAVIVVDAARRVLSRSLGEESALRVTLGSVLARMGAPSPSPGKTLIADHLDITPSSSGVLVAPGQRFSLVVDVNPGPRIHVYAPGNVDYIPIVLRVSPHPWLQVHEALFPASEEYLFVPLNERVQVYQRPFRIVQDVTMRATPEAEKALAAVQALEIDGELDYQACDEDVCFPPQTVALRWRVSVEPLDRAGRAVQ